MVLHAPASRHRPVPDALPLSHPIQNFRLPLVQPAEIEKAVRLQDLYKKIVEAIDTLALSEEYDLVILDDSSEALPFNRNLRVVPQEQVLQQLIKRTVLFVNPTLDITEDLIMRMNNEFNSVRSGP